MTIHAEDDAFTVRFDPSLVSIDDIKRCIRVIGYRPVEIGLLDLMDLMDSTAPRPSDREDELPPAIAEAVAKCDATGKLVFVDFYADWCLPCRKLEADLRGPELRESLQNFIVLRIDTDEEPDIARYFGIRALPTLMVLDAKVRERFKSVGIIGPADLKRALDGLSAKGRMDTDGREKEDI